MGSVDVRPVASWRDLGTFIELPFRLHSNAPSWVPPLRLERRLFLDRRLERVLQARRGAVLPRPARRPRRRPHHRAVRRRLQRVPRQPAGACSASSSSRTTRRSLPRAARAAAERWLRAHGRDRMVGPMDFTINDECGVLIEGFERDADDPHALAPAATTSALLRGGRARRRRWTCSCGSSTSPTATKILPIIFKLAEQVEPRHGDHACARCRGARLRARHRPLRRGLQRGLERELGLRRRTRRRTSTPTRRSSSSSSTSTGSWSPRPRRARRSAVAITMPDVNQVLKQDERPAAAVRLVALPAPAQDDRPRARRLPRRQAASISTRASRRRSTSSTSTRPTRTPQTWGEMGWILETNKNMNRAMEAMGGRDRAALPGLRAGLERLP